VVAAGADLADETGISSVSLAALAERLGVKPPALYKHVGSIGDLQHRIANLAMTQLGEAVRDALQGKSKAAAVAALFTALRSFLGQHAGRMEAANRARAEGPSDPLFAAGEREIDSFRAVLSGYDLEPEELDNAVRMLRYLIHGFALLQADPFHQGPTSEKGVAWMIRFVDAGLKAVRDKGDDNV
jgi:AcrR family transcriptional regulator